MKNILWWLWWPSHEGIYQWNLVAHSHNFTPWSSTAFHFPTLYNCAPSWPPPSRSPFPSWVLSPCGGALRNCSSFQILSFFFSLYLNLLVLAFFLPIWLKPTSDFVRSIKKKNGIFICYLFKWRIRSCRFLSSFFFIDIIVSCSQKGI